MYQRLKVENPGINESGELGVTADGEPSTST